LPPPPLCARSNHPRPPARTAFSHGPLALPCSVDLGFGARWGDECPTALPVTITLFCRLSRNLPPPIRRLVPFRTAPPKALHSLETLDCAWGAVFLVHIRFRRLRICAFFVTVVCFFGFPQSALNCSADNVSTKSFRISRAVRWRRPPNPSQNLVSSVPEGLLGMRRLSEACEFYRSTPQSFSQ